MLVSYPGSKASVYKHKQKIYILDYISEHLVFSYASIEELGRDRQWERHVNKHTETQSR